MLTTTVNSLTVVHKESGGTAIAFPDVCKTPVPGGMVPVPYPNVAMSKDTTDGSSTVKVDGNPIMLRGSSFSTSTGDEAGTGLSVLSNRIQGKAVPLTYSFDVMVDGDYVFRQFDLMLQNSGSPAGAVGSNSQASVAVPPPNLALPEWTVKWSEHELKCGDEVKIVVTDSGSGAGTNINLTVIRPPPEDSVCFFHAQISGGVTSIPWKTMTGPKPKNKVRLDIDGFGGGVHAKSKQPLMISVPAETTKPGSKQELKIPKFEKNLRNGKWVYSRIWSRSQNRWNYGYDLEIRDGYLWVTGRLRLIGMDGLTVSPEQKEGWKTEIELHWDKKWRLHRKACRRGTGCDCQRGCCVFPIRVKCKFVDHGEFADVEVYKGSPCDYPGDEELMCWRWKMWFESTCRHTRGPIRAHEFGHTLGLYDEYETGSNFVETDFLGRLKGPPPFENVPGSVMQWGTEVNENHMAKFRDWFVSVANDDYVLERL